MIGAASFAPSHYLVGLAPVRRHARLLDIAMSIAAQTIETWSCFAHILDRSAFGLWLPSVVSAKQSLFAKSFSAGDNLHGAMVGVLAPFSFLIS